MSAANRSRITPLKALVALAAGVAAAGLLTTVVRAYSLSSYKWSVSPVVVYLNPNNGDVTTTAAEAAVQSALNTWSQAGSAFRYQYGGRVSVTTSSYDGKNVMMFRNSSNGGAIASTYSWWSGGSRVDSDIIFWDGDWRFFTGTSGCSDGAYVEDVAMHELGHSLGLGHSSVTEATMYSAYVRCSTAMRSPSSDDIAGLKALYPGTSSSNTAPTVTIINPSSGTSVPQGTAVTFSGSASDSEDGTLSGSLAWTSSVDGQIGTGSSFSRVLSAGNHTITAKATDKNGLSGSKQISVSVAASNSAPTVTISAPSNGASFAQGASITFSGSATDTQDGNLTSSLVWTSSIDGQIGTGGSFSRTLTAGSHTITAKVVDSGALLTSKQVSVSVSTTSSTPVAPSSPSLSARGYKEKGKRSADLSWSGISTSQADVYRNGSRVASTPNDGKFTDAITEKGGGGSFTYKVCDQGTSRCSNQVSVSF